MISNYLCVFVNYVKWWMEVMKVFFPRMIDYDSISASCSKPGLRGSSDPYATHIDKPHSYKHIPSEKLHTYLYISHTVTRIPTKTDLTNSISFYFLTLRKWTRTLDFIDSWLPSLLLMISSWRNRSYKLHVIEIEENVINPTIFDFF